MWISFKIKTAVSPWARHIYPCLVLVQPRKTRPDITERLLTGAKRIKSTKQNQNCVYLDLWNNIHIDYYTVFSIPALISTRVDCISLSPKMEILGVSFNVLVVFSVRFWFEWGKIRKNKSIFFYIFCRCSLFVSPSRDQLLGRAGQENIGPYPPSFQPSTWVLDRRAGWAKSLVSRAILV